MIIGLFGIFKKKEKQLIEEAKESVTKSPEPPIEPKVEQERTLKEETFYLAGVYYYTKNIKKLGTPNPDYRKGGKRLAEEGKVMRKIFQYYFKNEPVELIPEPNNPHDKNAVAVHIDDELVGYIAREENEHVLDILKNHEIKYVSSFVSGGNYKVVSRNGDAQTIEDSISIKVKIGYV